LRGISEENRKKGGEMRPVILLLIGLFLAGCAEAVGENMTDPVKLESGTFTAYNALPEQTDDTPEITASGKRVKEGIVANNCLPFGTKIAVEDQIFEVQDRMNKRYGCNNFDIFMWDYQAAIEFGVQELNYEVI